MKKKLVVLTGAGISAESGIPTFRGSDGLWEGYDITEVASPEGWFRNKGLILDFYNQRRRGIAKAKPNKAHKMLQQLENKHEVTIITQNIDDLHERAGSSKIIHLHGEITKARSEKNINSIYDIGYEDIGIGDTCTAGHQLRPHIVWFGEPVPMIEFALAEILQADILIVIGTSLEVYPAAGLIHYLSEPKPIFLIDPGSVAIPAEVKERVTVIPKKAGLGMEELTKILT